MKYCIFSIENIFINLALILKMWKSGRKFIYEMSNFENMEIFNFLWNKMGLKLIYVILYNILVSKTLNPFLILIFVLYFH